MPWLPGHQVSAHYRSVIRALGSVAHGGATLAEGLVGASARHAREDEPLVQGQRGSAGFPAQPVTLRDDNEMDGGARGSLQTGSSAPCGKGGGILSLSPRTGLPGPGRQGVRLGRPLPLFLLLPC